jgi:hypothetical protein
MHYLEDGQQSVELSDGRILSVDSLDWTDTPKFPNRQIAILATKGGMFYVFNRKKPTIQ